MTNDEWDNSTTELDFEKHWSTVDIQHEVLRGVELRTQKPKTNRSQYDLVDISLPSCSKSPRITSSRKYRTRKPTKKTRLKPIRKDRDCPLRVVELAEPSKRQCLNTWKNNYRILPDYMVERLRRHVMDEEPIVRISEAVNYFKNKKTLKKSSTKNIKAKSKKIRDLNMTLCSFFAYKIRQKLIIPVNIVLNEKLTAINYVVTDEINSILRRKKNSASIAYKNEKIINEMAKKVTIWITNILEETSYNQFLEQLEEMEEEEGPVLDILDELLENVKMICKTPETSNSALSDNSDSICDVSLSTKKTEYGTESAFDDISEDSTGSKGFGYVKELENDKILSKNIEEKYYSGEMTLPEHLNYMLQERINYVVDNIDNIKTDNKNITEINKKTDLVSDPIFENNVSDLNQSTDSKNNLTPRIDHDGREDIITPEEEKTNVLTFNHLGSIINSESLTDKILEENNIDIDADAAVFDEMNDLSAEDLDEEIKKVTFSSIDMGNGEYGPQINKHSSDVTYDYNKLVTWKSSKDYILSHFNVAPPNPNLLSYIDEVWPEYMLPPLLKATESVNKSVISLGRILESNDENHILSPNQKSSQKNIDEILSEQLNTDIINLTDEGVDENVNENKDVKKSDDIYSNKEFNNARPVDDQPMVKEIFMQGFNQPSIEPLSIHFTTEEDVRVKINQNEDLQMLKNNISNKEIAILRHYNNETERQKHESQTSLGKLSANDEQIPEIFPSHSTVHLWKKTPLQECGDVTSIKSKKIIEQDLQQKLPINDSIKNKMNSNQKTPVNNMYTTINKKKQTSLVTNFNIDEFCLDIDENIRKWCTGLQNVTHNLELWTIWIQNVCSNIKYLKHEGMISNTATSKSKHMKKWIKLKKNTNADVQLWFQLRTRLHRGLRTYKHSYVMTRQVTSIQATKNTCNCKYKKNTQKDFSNSQIVFRNYYRNSRRV